MKEWYLQLGVWGLLSVPSAGRFFHLWTLLLHQLKYDQSLHQKSISPSSESPLPQIFDTIDTFFKNEKEPLSSMVFHNTLCPFYLQVLLYHFTFCLKHTCLYILISIIKTAKVSTEDQ